MNISVLGAGSWGTTIAVLLAEKDFTVKLWAYKAEEAESMIRHRENINFLKGVPFPDSLEATHDHQEALKDAEVIVIAIPSQAIRASLIEFTPFLTPDQSLIVNLSKGIEVESGLRMSEVINEVLPEVPSKNIITLYGPSHAEEVSQKQPTTVVASCTCEENARKIQDIFMTPMFRVYVNTDPIGVEIGGSVKNIMAIAAGISDGLGYGDNAKAAIITRGLAEITRFGLKSGAKPETFSGLAGVGDLVVTCSSRHSRNRKVGEMIGQGKTLDEILQNMMMVAEGIETTRAVRNLSKKIGVDMPITQSVYDMLFLNKPVKQAVLELMSRDPKPEIH
jgi:glycerol-3-phosphate dehydrogenase (NAD(P)+)